MEISRGGRENPSNPLEALGRLHLVRDPNRGLNLGNKLTNKGLSLPAPNDCTPPEQVVVEENRWLIPIKSFQEFISNITEFVSAATLLRNSVQGPNTIVIRCFRDRNATSIIFSVPDLSIPTLPSTHLFSISLFSNISHNQSELISPVISLSAQPSAAGSPFLILPPIILNQASLPSSALVWDEGQTPPSESNLWKRFEGQPQYKLIYETNPNYSHIFRLWNLWLLKFDPKKIIGINNPNNFNDHQKLLLSILGWLPGQTS